jgi:hypothetical protein
MSMQHHHEVLTEAQLPAGATARPLIVLDAAGSVVDLNEAAARWAGVSAWQLRGRALARELTWAFGADAAREISAFLVDSAPSARVHAVGHRRGHAVEADVELCRDHDRVWLAIL